MDGPGHIQPVGGRDIMDLDPVAAMDLFQGERFPGQVINGGSHRDQK